MGFCLSCGELANTARCPRCKGKVSGASAAGLSNRDAWSATYLDKQNKKVHAPNLDKLTRKKSFDATLPSLELNSSPANSEELFTGGSTLEKINSITHKTTQANEKSEPVVNCLKCLGSINSESEPLLFNGKKYHKDCLPCLVCGKKILETPIDVEGEAHCKSCFFSQGASSNSSPTLITPDNERVETEESATSSNSLKLMGDIQPDNEFLPRAPNKSLNNSRISQITDKLQTLRTSPTARNSLEIPAQASPSYSRTFSQLQATVNNQVSSSPSVRTRPRKTSESSGGLSFADLLNNRRGQDSRLGTISRRPLSMMSTELNKRNSLPVAPKKTTSEAIAASTSNPVIPPSTNRLSRHRPNSIHFNDKRVEAEPTQEVPNREAIKRANRTFSFIPPHSPSRSQGSRSSSRASSSRDSPASVPQPDLSVSAESPLSDLKSVESTPDPVVPQPLSRSPDSGLDVKKLPSESLSSSVLSSKLNCSKCETAISDTWFKLPDGRVLHKECFQCHQCNKVIEDGKYSVYDDQEYHTDCLLQLPTSPMSDVSLDPEDFCDRCNSAIKGPCFTLTNGRQYHPNCFICAGCKKRFDQGTYVSQGDNEYHRECVPKRELINCGKCSEPIRGVFVTNNNMNFHSECFRCTGCQKIITPSTPFGEVAQQPYCEPCLVNQRTARQSSFAVSAARQEQRRSANPSPSIRH